MHFFVVVGVFLLLLFFNDIFVFVYDGLDLSWGVVL